MNLEAAAAAVDLPIYVATDMSRNAFDLRFGKPEHEE